MKKVAILTLNGHDNYGNRLQNYALEQTIKRFDFNVESLWFETYKDKVIRVIKFPLYFLLNKKRRILFFKFSKKNINIKYFNKKKYLDSYDYIIVGSDQVWNPNFDTFDDIYLLNQDFLRREKKISYAASFAVNIIDEKYENLFSKSLIDFNSISVRENSGKKIVEDLTGRNDVEVLIDPTMLLNSIEWNQVSTKPKKLKSDRYILNYFLGKLSNERKKVIEKIAKENNCEIINILDKNSPFYQTGPSEFLYLEKNAFLICTDSFHSSVFAILFDRPFIIFDREQEEMGNMSSRLETLLSTFKLENRKYNGREITKENLDHDYTEAYKILEKEREKSKKFLMNALDIDK